MAFTLKHIEQLQQSGKIKGFKEMQKAAATRQSFPLKKGSKTKEWIQLHLVAWCGANKLQLQEEVKFHPERKWRFDWALPGIMVAIEYEGIFSEKSRHTSAKGFTGDTDKYNAAQALGWKVFRYTASNYKQLINDLNKLL